MNSSGLLYTILYPFMWDELGLCGYAKEVFAVIFNFWLKLGEKPVFVSLTTIQKITGASRPAASSAVAFLIEHKHLDVIRNRGKTSQYSILIDPQLLAEFKARYRSTPVHSFNQQESTILTATSSVPKPQKQRKAKTNDSTLRVKEEINTGGLPEAK